MKVKPSNRTIRRMLSFYIATLMPGLSPWAFHTSVAVMVSLTIIELSEIGDNRRRRRRKP